MEIQEIAEKINQRSEEYNIGALQEIRKSMKKLKKISTRKIFGRQSIVGPYAFHTGGIKEIQFNIGWDNSQLRYGLAISLKPTRNLPDVSILYPKVLKLNCLIRESPEFFESYRMWFWNKEVRSPTMSVHEVSEERLCPGTFIFFGKVFGRNSIDIDVILREFDVLLPIYISIESQNDSDLYRHIQGNQSFRFMPESNYQLNDHRSVSIVERSVNIDVRHTLIQRNLVEILRQKYGPENVSYENPINGQRIDVVRKDGDEYIFYEIKIASSARACIRQAFGQLIDYAFFPNVQRAKKLVIVGENTPDDDCIMYLSYLRDTMNINIDYRQISL